MPGPTPRSLILDLLSTLARGTMPVAALVDAGRLFDLAPGSVRVALARLLRDGSVERDLRGRYRLGAAAVPISSRVRSWRGLDARGPVWDGDWWAAHDAGAPRKGAGGRRHERALRWLGFRRLKPGLCVRPANLRGGCDGVRAELAALGLSPRTLVFVARELAITTEDARALYDVDALRSGHLAALAELESSSARLGRHSSEEAMRESFLVGGRAIARLAVDPLLPPAIQDPRERDALVRAMRDYDQRGRESWAAFLARYDVPHRRAPADTLAGDAFPRRVA